MNRFETKSVNASTKLLSVHAVFVCVKIFSEKVRETDRQNRECLIPWMELKKLQKETKNDKSMCLKYF